MKIFILILLQSSLLLGQNKLNQLDSIILNTTNIDFNRNGIIENSEALNLKTLSVSDLKLKSLDGIEKYLNITELNCSDNQLKELKLKNFKKLKGINCSNNKIQSIKLINLNSLILFQFSNNAVTNLKTTNTEKIKILNGNNNQIKFIDLKRYKNLQFLDLIKNKIEKIDARENSDLVGLYLDNNMLHEIDLSNLKKLQRLEVSNNNLNKIDLSYLLVLNTLYISGNNISKIDLTQNPNLVIFSGGGFKKQDNYFTEINLNDNQKFVYFTLYPKNSDENTATLIRDHFKDKVNFISKKNCLYLDDILNLKIEIVREVQDN